MKRSLTHNERLSRFNQELCTKIQSGDDNAKQLLILANKGLVIANAILVEKEYSLNSNPYGGWDIEDLIQEGYLALIDAALSFSPEAGAKFSTYATEVIRNKMRDVGRRTFGTFEKHSVDDGLTNIFLDDDPANVYRDEYIGQLTAEASVDSHRDPTGELAVHRTMLLKMLIRLQDLPSDARKVLTYHYGFSLREGRTLEATARHFNKSKETVKGIEQSSLQHLRVAMNDYSVT